MPNKDYVILFIHGYSVTDIETYGKLPERLRNEAYDYRVSIDSQDIFLGEYISFHDEVKIQDIARALNRAITDQEQRYPGKRFICITHSTGGPVVRTWWHTYYLSDTIKPCPISHLIMLAPANFGSPLAQLGKKKLSRIWSEFKQVEPGVGVLNWLEQGSEESWKLNEEWIHSDHKKLGPDGIFLFVITGDYIDRRVYTQAIPFTQEIGSDGVVRAASANLNSAHMLFSQEANVENNLLQVERGAELKFYKKSPHVPFLIVPKRSHSGQNMGIMNSVDASRDDANNPTIKAIFDCLTVESDQDYKKIFLEFQEATELTYKEGLVEPVPWFDIGNRLKEKYYIHDRYCMIIFRLKDTSGFPIPVYDVTLTAGPEGNPNNFPAGFMGREQTNSNNPGILTYYINYDLLMGTKKIVFEKKKTLRDAIPGIGKLGFNIYPYPTSGFVFYKPITIWPNEDLLEKMIQKNKTALVDIIFQRLVAKETFEFNNFEDYESKRLSGRIKDSFKDKKSSNDAVE